MSEVVERAYQVAQFRLSGLARRWAHVQGVAAVAERIRGHLDTGTGDYLVASAWAHDIGYAPSLRVTGFHPLDGARFLRDEGFPEQVVSLVAFHSGASVEARVRGIEGLSDFAEPDPESLDALVFCDLTTGPDGSAVSARERLDEVLARYRPDDPVHRAVSISRAELLAAVGRVQAWLRSCRDHRT
ncbi:MAG: HD domain-containing protein [Actinomycetia bacterium]|nr:HD domain-containing protein [Actinomycetes bacterium]